MSTLLQNEPDQRVVADCGLVSVIMPNYNSEKFVTDTIKSVLAQTYKNWELIFVDDCSTDNSLDIVRSFADERIKIIKCETNGGAAVARNVAIDAARGRWMAFLDSDDIWHPQKLERQLAFMTENNYGFSFTHYGVIDDGNKEISEFKPVKDKYSYRDILKHNHIGCLTAVYDVEALGKVYMPTNAAKREDLACWLAILRSGTEAYCLHDVLASYKVHSGSVSSNKVKMIKYQWNVYRKVERMNPFKSAYYLIHWGISGIFKYR